jgi:hypothetical protein
MESKAEIILEGPVQLSPRLLARRSRVSVNQEGSTHFL